MDPRERQRDRQESFRMALDGRQNDIHTGFPGIIVSYNAQAITAVVQPAIMAQVRDETGTWNSVKMPTLLDCPVFFPGGGGFELTFPIQVGDEVWVNIAERCIDSWWQNAGIQQQAEFRVHDLSDGFCFPRIWSQPKKPSGPLSTTTTQLRSDDGQLYVELAGGHICNVVAPGGINLNGVTIDKNGNVAAPGDVTAGAGSGDSVTLQNHTHSASGGTGNGGPPNAGT
jgi:hypothetical protein